MYLGSMFLQTLFSYSDVQMYIHVHTHAHTHTHTFLFTLVEKSTSERKVCSPLISLFRSLSNTLRAIQIPGWCLAPFLVLFLWSDLVTRSLKRVGAFTFTSSIPMRTNQLCLLDLVYWELAEQGWGITRLPTQIHH